jgi:hypothetical protein
MAIVLRSTPSGFLTPPNKILVLRCDPRERLLLWAYLNTVRHPRAGPECSLTLIRGLAPNWRANVVFELGTDLRRVMHQWQLRAVRVAQTGTAGTGPWLHPK